MERFALRPQSGNVVETFLLFAVVIVFYGDAAPINCRGIGCDQTRFRPIRLLSCWNRTKT